MEFFKFEMDESLTSKDTNIFRCGDTVKMKFKKNSGKCGDVTIPTQENRANLKL